MIEVTSANINDFTILDVVFPIIGHSVSLPSNQEMNKIIKDIMSEDNISMAMFASQAQSGATSATGSYRKIIAKAEQI